MAIQPSKVRKLALNSWDWHFREIVFYNLQTDKISSLVKPVILGAYAEDEKFFKRITGLIVLPEFVDCYASQAYYIFSDNYLWMLALDVEDDQVGRVICSFQSYVRLQQKMMETGYCQTLFEENCPILEKWRDKGIKSDPNTKHYLLPLKNVLINTDSCKGLVAHIGPVRLFLLSLTRNFPEQLKLVGDIYKKYIQFGDREFDFFGEFFAEINPSDRMDCQDRIIEEIAYLVKFFEKNEDVIKLPAYDRLMALAGVDSYQGSQTAVLMFFGRCGK